MSGYKMFFRKIQFGVGVIEKSWLYGKQITQPSMKVSQILVIVLFCIAAACSKKKDDLVTNEPPVTNDPPPGKPADSTGTQPKPKPIFTDFAPATAYIGDTITITGTDLGTNTGNIIVQFGGGVYASVISATGTQVQVVVPDDIEIAKTKIAMQVGDTMLSVNKDFTLKPPVITSMTPTIGFARQFIKITGKGFRKSYKFDMVTIGTKVIEKSAIVPGHDSLSVPLPESLQAGVYTVMVTVAGVSVTAPGQLEVRAPTIQSISATTAPVLSELIIKGDNFIDPNGSTTQVFFIDANGGGMPTQQTVINAISNNEIKLRLPVIPAGDYKVAVRVVGSMVYAGDKLTITNK